MAAAIDGTDGRAWHLPLPPLTRTSLEPHAPGVLLHITLWFLPYEMYPILSIACHKGGRSSSGN